MAVLDTTIVNIALRTLTKDLHTDLDSIQWVVTGYLLAIAAIVPLTGWAARRFTAKRVYLWSLIVFTFGSALFGLAQNVHQLILFRVIQGIGGGAIVPVGQMILVKAAGPQKLGRIIAAYGVPTILAPVFGPTIGGFIIDTVGWSWIFYVNVFIGAVAIVAGVRRLPVEEVDRSGRIDILGVGLAVMGLMALTYGLSRVGHKLAASRDATRPAAILVTDVLLLAAFVVRSLRISRPLLDRRLYANKAFSSAAVTLFCLGAALIGTAILMPLYYQTIRHEGASITGLLVAPRGVGATAGTWVSGRLLDRMRPGKLAAIGVFVTLVFSVPFVTLTDDTLTR
jgi:EmrB/QacA subfamily drug resistance transporter